MAKVLQNFLIGVGLDTEDYDKGAKNVESSLSRMRSLVGFTGAAIAGAFGFAGVAAVNAGKRVLDFHNAAESLKTPTGYVYAYGNALEALGGNANEALAAIKAAENALTQFELKGEFAPFNEMALAGVRDELNALLHSANGGELLRGLSGIVPSLDKYQQKLIQDSINLSDVVMVSLRGGTSEFDANIDQASALYGEFGRATEAAREYSRAVAELNTRFEGIGETLAVNILPSFTSVIDSLGGFIDRNRDVIDGSIEKLGQLTSANPVATTIAGSGAAAAATGAGLRMIGLRGLGMTATRFGAPGMAIGSGLLAADAAKDWSWGDWWKQSKDNVSDSWSSLTGKNDYSNLPDAPYGSAVPNVLPGSIESLPVYSGNEINNEEAARANPEVIIINGQRQQSENSVRQRPLKIENKVDLNVEIDGRPIEAKVIDVMERRERDAMDDVYSSVDR